MFVGFTDDDLDDVKGIFTDTNLYLLCLTVIVTAVHVRNYLLGPLPALFISS